MRNFEMSLESLIEATITLGNWLVLTPQILNWIIIISSATIGLIIILVLVIVIVRKRKKKKNEIGKIVEEKEIPTKTINIHTTLRVVEIIGMIKQEGDRVLLQASDGSIYNLHTIAPWESQDTLKDSENLRENIGKNVEIIGDSDGNAIWKARINKIIK